MNGKSYYLIILFLSFCIGCGSQLPYVTTFPMQTQRRMQAAKHWAVLAEDVAQQVKSCIGDRKDLILKPVSIVSKKETPFEEIFHEILISKLVSRGIIVSRKNLGAMELEYNVKLLEHSHRTYQKVPFKFTALSAGVMVARNLAEWATRDLLLVGTHVGALSDVAISHYGGPPSNKEIIITTSLSYDDYYFMHQSDIYYINDPDAGNYVKEKINETNDNDQNGRTFDVVE
jgi:hypothetical protein